MIEHRTASGAWARNTAFAEQIQRQSGIAVQRCYQCLTCTLGCDAAFAMDYKPHQIVRLVQLGFKQQALSSTSIWVCTACEACVTRCPNEIDIPHLMDTLHQLAQREGMGVPEPAVPTFHDAFLEPVKRYGRQFEALMTGLFMLRARRIRPADIIANAGLGLALLRRGKLKFKPPSIKGAAAVRAIFRKTLESRKS